MNQIKELSKLNTGWGICGFASVLGFLYNNGNIKSTVDKAVQDKSLKYRLLAEIKTFLTILKSEGKTKILDGIKDFTRTFPNLGNFTIEAYIKTINDVVNNGANENDEKFTIAMTREGLVEYLKIIGNKPNATVTNTGTSTKDNVILGLGDKNNKLKHWVYKVSNEKVYNWGEQKSLNDVINECGGLHIIYEISF